MYRQLKFYLVSLSLLIHYTSEPNMRSRDSVVGMVTKLWVLTTERRSFPGWGKSFSLSDSLWAVRPIHVLFSDTGARFPEVKGRRISLTTSV